jgi:cytochrome c-type biogenesis protein CcmH
MVVGILALALTPLFTSTKQPGLSAALRDQKLRIADELAEIGRLRASGELNEEEFAACQRALETEARSTFEAERQAQQTAQPKGNQGLVRGLVAALFFILTANIVAGVYLYKGGWRQIAIGLDTSSAQGGGEGGEAPPMAQGGGAPDPNVMVARLEKKLQENPNDAKGQAMLGRSYLVLERFEESAKAYQKAVELEPDNVDFAVGLGVATVRTGRTDEAAKVFADILKKEPGNPDALWFTGMLQVHRKDMEGAKKTFKTLLDSTPQEQKAEMQGQIDKVMQALNRPEGMPKAQ